MDYEFLSTTNLFKGIAPSEIQGMLLCLNSRVKNYKKDEIILRAGSKVSEIGLVVSGSVNVVVNFYWGTSSIFGHVKAGEIFAENYAAVPDQELSGDVVAAEDTTVLFMTLSKVVTSCDNHCAFHQRLTHNLLFISAKKSLELSTRMMHTASKSIRDRLLSYLTEQAIINNDSHFFIPFNRQQLADYLGVDRSAMSNELSKMQKEGLITFRKNEFTLLQ